MPRIKYPINAQETLYNKRYEVETQKIWVAALMNPKSTKDWDEYKRDFLRNSYAMLNCFMKLTEKQADYLAELYDKYSN